MKKVAGTLRLELAAYRELASFAQFGSDLDAATQAKLARGERLIEILKQKVNSPLSFYHQAISIFAATNGYIDGLQVKQIHDFEVLLFQKLEARSDLIKSLESEKKLTDDIKAQFTALCDEALKEFEATHTTTTA
jgi:F-type H+-transporting ATPase subunit alpha